MGSPGAACGPECVWQTVLTVGLSTDQACGGTVEEGEQARHRQADVGVGWPQVQGGEPGELHLQNVLGSHLHVRHLRHTSREATQTQSAPARLLHMSTRASLL